MPIIAREGNIFDTELSVIGQGVNTQGVMGSGFAEKIRLMYPDVDADYIIACDTKELEPGGMLPLKSTSEIHRNFVFLNLASQELTGANARYDLLETSIEAAFEWVANSSYNAFALPQIGAGVGALEWRYVEAIIENQSKAYPEITVEIWYYKDGTEAAA